MQLTRTAVHIMHPDPIIVAGLYGILVSNTEFSLSTHAIDPQGARDADIVIADHAVGVARARQPVAAGPRILVIAPTAREGEVKSAIDSGVHGYVLQSTGSGEIVAALRALLRGANYFCDSAKVSASASLAREALTKRETDVLQLLAQGCCNKIIARRLNIGVGTVKTHLKSLMMKLNVHARTEALVVATERGLVVSTPDGLRLPERRDPKPKSDTRQTRAALCAAL